MFDAVPVNLFYLVMFCDVCHVSRENSTVCNAAQLTCTDIVSKNP